MNTLAYTMSDVRQRDPEQFTPPWIMGCVALYGSWIFSELLLVRCDRELHVPTPESMTVFYSFAILHHQKEIQKK
jgi:hypothetical protein